jgi:Winged helix-turn-helix DNA-binding
MTTNRFISLKEISAILELSPSTVRRRLRDFGLDACRDKLLKKPIRFHAAAAGRVLAEKGFTVRL